VKTVDELEAERNQQRHEQQQIGRDRRRLGAAILHIDHKAVGDVEQSARQEPAEYDNAFDIAESFELRSRVSRYANAGMGGEIGHSHLQTDHPTAR
jgi:hypothetical protein